MDDQQIKELLAQTEAQWKKQSDELMQGYVNQYQALAAKAAEDMRNMVADAIKVTHQQSQPEEVHMQWAEVEGHKVLILSEKAGKEILGVFDTLAKLLPELQKALKKR